MGVSKEYESAVREHNLLRMRIMLKDSLLLDKTFQRFDEMVNYAEAKGVSVWMHSDDMLERSSKPWKEDVMNYELTVLVNDFTREHVDYVKEIIKDIYSKGELSQIRQNTEGYQSSHSENGKDYKAILIYVNHINNILDGGKDKKTKTRIWRDTDIDSIKEYAKGIEDACYRIQRRR